MQCDYKNIEQCKPERKRKVLIVFDYLITVMICNKIPNQIVTDIFIRERKVNIYTFLNTQSYFVVPKDIRL